MDLFYLFQDIQIDSFQYPRIFFLLVIPVLCVFLMYFLRKRIYRRIVIPRLESATEQDTDKTGVLENAFVNRSNFHFLKKSPRFWAFVVAAIFITAGYVLMIIALAHPYGGSVTENRTEGIDIYFALDMSASMKAYDYSRDEVEASYFLNSPKPNRFEVAKTTVYNFIQSRSERCHETSGTMARCDRVGIILFGQFSFVDVPMTKDYEVLSNHILNRHLDDIESNQSAIGDGLMTAVASLRHSDSKSKNIILVSDGDSKGGRASIGQAITAANTYDIRIFPIVIGKSSSAVLAIQNYDGGITFKEAEFPVKESILSHIAESTNGQAYRASTDEEFQNMLSDVLEQLEPDVSVDNRNANQVDLSLYFVLLSFFCCLIAFITYHLFCRRFP